MSIVTARRRVCGLFGGGDENDGKGYRPGMRCARTRAPVTTTYVRMAGSRDCPSRNRTKRGSENDNENRSPRRRLTLRTTGKRTDRYAVNRIFPSGTGFLPPFPYCGKFNLPLSPEVFFFPSVHFLLDGVCAVLVSHSSRSNVHWRFTTSFVFLPLRLIRSQTFYMCTHCK